MLLYYFMDSLFLMESTIILIPVLIWKKKYVSFTLALFNTFSLSSVFVFFLTFSLLKFFHLYFNYMGFAEVIESVNICFSVNLENVQPLYFKFFLPLKILLWFQLHINWIDIFLYHHWNFVFLSVFIFCLFYNDLLQIHCDLFIWCDQFSKSIQIFSNSRIFIWPFWYHHKFRALNKLYQLAGPWFGNSVYLDGGNCWNICLPHTAFF